MEKLDKGFAAGAVVAAFVIGGVLYTLYPSTFSGYDGGSGATSTASSAYSDSAAQTTSTAAVNNTADQNATDVSMGNTSSPQPSSNNGY